MHVVDLALVIVSIALFTGAILQGAIGFGMVVLAFPTIVLVEPDLLPQSILIAGLPPLVMNAWRNRRGADLREVGWITLGRVPGLIGGVALVATVSSAYLALGGGLVVLSAVALSIWAPSLRRTVPTLLGVGTISALFGTTIAIGGPPLGLLYQHESGPRLRGTISLLMLAGGPISLLLLALGGQVSAIDVRTGLALMPASVLGTLVAPTLTHWFDERLRLTVLGVCAFTAVIAMTRVLWTL